MESLDHVTSGVAWRAIEAGMRSLCFLFAWIIAIAAGYFALVNYSTTPKDSAVASRSWPEGVLLERDAMRPTLVMFLHPKCPCSTASLRMIEQAEGDRTDALTALFVFTKPADQNESWCHGAAWNMVAEIPLSKRYVDTNGRIASRFGAICSGETYIYGADGRLLFHGGITGSRGHEGDCIGTDAIHAIARGRLPKHDTSPVYGCQLVLPMEEGQP